jgi:predicted transcriptional regulator
MPQKTAPHSDPPIKRKILPLSAYVKALEETDGFFTKAADLLGVTQSAVSLRVKRNKKLQKIVAEIEDKRLDTAESALFQMIAGKDGVKAKVTSTIFYLKTKGAKRGYIERRELQGPGGGPVKIVLVEGDEDDALNGGNGNGEE